MKSKYRSLGRFLPVAITIALSSPFAAQAGIFADDTGGNAQPTVADNGANTIRANGGTSATPFITITSSVSMTGDAAETEIVEITGTSYTMTNAGSLIGTNHNGIFSSQAFSLTNNGTIRGGTTGGRRGILTVGGTTTITNNLTISGTEDGIHFTTDGGTVTNSGSISGTTGAASNGILGRNSLTVNNNTNFDIFTNPISGGSINGLQYGILADNNLTVNNQFLATITGTQSGISADNTARITNSGTITGTNGDGIFALDNAGITNNAGDIISGGQNGINAEDNATIVNVGSITGLADSGMRLGDAADVTNSGTISGLDYGINLGNNITTSVVSNQSGGSISGDDYGILGGTGVERVTNAGTITGNISALQLSGGANEISLFDGSVINGNARASGGSLAVTMNGGKTSATDTSLNIIDGALSDAISLSKTGSGMAVITSFTRADTISVTGGSLYLLNNVSTSATTENVISVNGAEIGGIAVWDSAITLINGASISPGQSMLSVTNTVADSLGDLVVTGDVTLDSTSSYVWNATPGGASDTLNLQGAGNVFTTSNSDFVISPTNVNSPLLDGFKIVVNTAEVLVGNFTDISVATFPGTTPDTGMFQANQNDPIIAAYFASLAKVNGSQDWQLTIAHDYGQFGSNPNEVAAGNMLTGLVSTATGDMADLFAAMDYSDESVTEAVLAALDPGAYMATAAMLANNNYQLHRTVEAHNAAVRAGTASCDGASNVWGSFSYDTQDLNTSSNAFDQDGDVTSFTGGIDFTVSENFRLGLVAQGSQTDFDGDFDLGSEVDSYRFAAYANWGAATGWFVDALFGYNNHDVDQTRGIFMTQFATESASFDADGWQGLINVGYSIETGAGLVSPFVGLEWQQLSVDSFSTTDAMLPLGVGGFDIDSFRALAGVRWEGDLADNVKGYASFAYAFEFEDDAPDTKVDFGGGSYRATGLERGDSMLLSAGVRWGVADCTTIDIGYRGEFAMDDGVDSNGGNIGVNYTF